MGFSVAISGGIVCVTIMIVFSLVFAMTGQIYEINSSRTKSSDLENVIIHTNTNASYVYGQSGSNLVSLTFENIGNEKLWNYEKFNVLVTYNASSSGSPSLTTERLTYNSAQAFAQAGSNIGAQFARPDEDISKGGWTDTTGGDSDGILYDEVNEIVQNDGNYATSGGLFLGSSDTWLVGLQGVADPETSSDHIVRVAHRKTGLGNVDLTTRLLQGNTEIASWTDAMPAGNFLVSTHTLNTAQADSITNYSDLKLEFIAESGVILISNADISWAEFEVPTRQGVYDCSAVTLSSGRWIIDRISGDLQDPKILNTEEDGKLCIKLSNTIYANSYVTAIITTDSGKTISDRFKA